MRVLGLDGFRDGWVGILLDEAGYVGAIVDASLERAVQRAAGAGSVDGQGPRRPGAAPLDVVGIDMPIGLADRTDRAADLAARELLGRRASTVFLTPVRSALAEPTHARASQRNRELTGRGISAQAFALRPRILEVDAWLRAHRQPGADAAGPEVLEVHPELAFQTMAGQPLEAPKRRWAGAIQRRTLLAARGIALPDNLGAAGRAAGVDDVLDAAAVAWTARRFARGEAMSVPDPPEVFSDGIPAAIWR